MKILYSHVGIEGRDGWGRSFFLAMGLSALGHEVYFLTTSRKYTFKLYTVKQLHGVKVIIFNDIIPTRFLSSGFGLLSIIGKLTIAVFKRFDLVISDCSHRPSGIPCFVNQFLFNSVHITEWWDYFGKGGYFDTKSILYKIMFGYFESWFEIKSKKIASGVVVLSKWMENRAMQNNISKSCMCIIHGGTIVDQVYFNKLKRQQNKKLTLGYLGMSDQECLFLIPFLEAISDPRISSYISFYSYGGYLSQKTIDHYKLNGIISERGWIDLLETNFAFSEVDVFVMLRKVDDIALAGWPNKLGDYLAIGRPVLINPYGDLIEIVNTNTSGFIIVEFNKESIVRGILDILNGKYNLDKGASANRMLAEKMSWQSKSKEILNFYFELNKSKR